MIRRLGFFFTVAAAGGGALLLGSCSLFGPQYQLVIRAEGAGTVAVDPAGASGTYPAGTTVTLTAKPSTGWYLSAWSADGSGASTSIKVVMDSDKSVTALFSLATGFSLTGQWSSPTASNSLETSSTASRSTAPFSFRTVPVARAASDVSTTQIVVRYKNGVVRDSGLAARVTAVGSVVRSSAHSGIWIDAVKIKPGSGQTMAAALAYLRGLPQVASAQPDVIRHALCACVTPSDPGYTTDQFDLQQLEMPNAWYLQQGSSDVVVAVVDTGFYRLLPDYDDATTVNPTNVQAGYNAITGTADTDPYSGSAPSTDDNGHGTHVTGTVAEAANGKDVLGMAYGVTIMPIKVLDASGSGTDSGIIAGIQWALSQNPKPKVINLSLGGPDPDDNLHDVMCEAYEEGVAVIAAAGNDGSSTLDYPAAYSDCVLSVGAVGYDDALASYSNYGPLLDVVAPGGNPTGSGDDSPEDWIWQETIDPGASDYSGQLYGYAGTSMATPHVSALAALLFSQNASMTPAQVYRQIENTATDLGSSGRDDAFGFGLIDPTAALSGSLGNYAQNQSVTGYVDPIGTKRIYSFSATASATATFYVSVTSGPGSAQLKLLNSTGNVVTQSTAGAAASLSYEVPSAGTYRIEVDYVE